MRTKLLFILLLVSTFSFASPIFQQNSYRWREDNGDQTTATWKAALNTPTLPNATGQPLRLRITVLETAARAGSMNTMPLQYRKNGGAWVTITNSNTNDFYFVSSANVTNNAATTQQISTGTFSAGQFKSDAANSTISMGAATRTEIEYCIARSLNYDQLGTYQFQISGLNNYSVYPTLNPICVTPAPTVNNVQYNVGDSATPLTATGTNLLWYTTATGGTGSITAPTPSTATPGTTDFFVSQTLNGCEGPRARLTVYVSGGQQASCLNFDGINDGIALTSNGFPLGNNPRTIEAWIKTTQNNGGGCILTYGDNTTNNRFGLYQTGGKLNFVGSFNDYNTNVSINDNVWHHVAATFDGTNLKVYIDGLQVGTTQAKTFNTTGTVFSIGNQTVQGEYFYGNIDDVRVWNFAKTNSQISDSVNCELQGTETGLVGYYKFNQGFDGQNNSTVTTAIDNSTSGNNGTLNYFYLNGATSNWISGGSPLAPISYNQIFCGPATVANLQVSGINGGTFNWYDVPTSGSPLALTTALTTGTYYVSKVNGTCENSRFSISVVVSSIPSVPTVTTPVIYNQGDSATALTATTGGTGLLWYTNATGGTGSTTLTPSTSTAGSTSYWVSSTNANGCESARAEIVVTVNAPATHLNFDGVDDRVVLGNILPTSYTKEAWINISNSAFKNNILSSDNTSQHALWAPNDYSNKLSAGHNGIWNQVQDPTSLLVNTWYHVAVTYDAATTTMKLYKNGALVSSNTAVPAYTGTNDLQIGAYGGANNLFKGNIDEVRIWNKALSATDIVNTMNCELLTPASQPGLVAYYKFNQGFDTANNSTVTTATDSSANGNTRTLNGFALTGATSNWLSGSPVTTGNTCAALSNNEFTANTNFKVYPNPATNNVTIQFTDLNNVKLEVIDITGKLLMKQNLNSNSNTVNIEQLPSGLYMFKVSSSEGTATTKVVKQ